MDGMHHCGQGNVFSFDPKRSKMQLAKFHGIYAYDGCSNDCPACNPVSALTDTVDEIIVSQDVTFKIERHGHIERRIFGTLSGKRRRLKGLPVSGTQIKETGPNPLPLSEPVPT